MYALFVPDVVVAVWLELSKEPSRSLMRHACRYLGVPRLYYLCRYARRPDTVEACHKCFSLKRHPCMPQAAWMPKLARLMREEIKVGKKEVCMS